MAKKTTAKPAGDGAKAKKPARKAGAASKPKAAKAPPKAKPKSSSKSAGAERPESKSNAADALVKLIESPLVVDLIAVAATAALASIAEQRFSREGKSKGTSRAAKAAGKAAAAAVGRRIGEEWEEIRRAAETKEREAK